MRCKRHNPARQAQAGLTLIEVVIAMSILALLTIVISVSWRIAATAQGRVDREVISQRGREAAIELMERQFASAVAVRNPEAAIEKTAFFQGSATGVRFISRYSLEGKSRAGLVLVDYQIVRQEAGDHIISRELPVRALSDLVGTQAQLESAPLRELPLRDDQSSYSFSFVVADVERRTKLLSAAWMGQDGVLPAGVVLQAAGAGAGEHAEEWTFPLHARDLEREAPRSPFFPFR